jgi:hypothetical protein
MVIAEAIREAETEYVVYFLLEAYLNAESRRLALKTLPARIGELPVSGKQDVKSRYAMLQAESAAAIRRGDEKARAASKEALMVFAAALTRLQALDGQRSIASARVRSHISQSPGSA